MQDIGDVFRILYPAPSYFLVEIRAILWLAKHVPIRQLLSARVHSNPNYVRHPSKLP